MTFFRIFGRREPSSSAGAVAKIRSVALTHVGLVRAVNEDRVLNLPESGLWAVADGMGGHNSGDVAAQIAIDVLENVASKGQALCGDDILAGLQSANRLIYDRYTNAKRHSGTTIVTALQSEDMLEVFWAGDSRAYRLRADRWELLTRDHSVVQQMVDAGALPQSAAVHHPQSNVITRALGVNNDVVIDRVVTKFSAGDVVLLCSDGVSRTFSLQLPGTESIESFAQSLLDHALAHDGNDNATLILIVAD